MCQLSPTSSSYLIFIWSNMLIIILYLRKQKRKKIIRDWFKKRYINDFITAQGCKNRNVTVCKDMQWEEIMKHDIKSEMKNIFQIFSFHYFLF